MDIKNTNVIITGAAAGFGKAMSLHFLAKGATIFALDIDEDSLSSLRKESNYKINVYKCDVSNNTEVEEVIENIFKTERKINVLINNAGIMKNAPLVNLLNRPDGRHSTELWDSVIKVNQNSVFYMTRSVVNQMIKNRNKGVIINISSIAAKGNIGQTAYSATKAAVEAMSKVWSKELGVFGIRSMCVAPGFINTIGAHDALEEKMLSNWVARTPLRRTGEVEEIVKSIDFIIENDFLNGEVIHVNGGLSI
ncbi:SDR family oxidoreductase [Polaribacter uvawellassae]|uniref:SDR family oxidoreductase n=1 Tax=Polaribacter uvawellassae TaxID=3133495 RepID=UPI003218E601